MSSSLRDGGLRNALVIYIEHSRVASVYAARAGAADSHRSWDLVDGTARSRLDRI